MSFASVKLPHILPKLSSMLLPFLECLDSNLLDTPNRYKTLAIILLHRAHELVNLLASNDITPFMYVINCYYLFIYQEGQMEEEDYYDSVGSGSHVSTMLREAKSGEAILDIYMKQSASFDSKDLALAVLRLGRKIVFIRV